MSRPQFGGQQNTIAHVMCVHICGDSSHYQQLQNIRRAVDTWQQVLQVLGQWRVKKLRTQQKVKLIQDVISVRRTQRLYGSCYPCNCCYLKWHNQCSYTCYCFRKQSRKFLTGDDHDTETSQVLERLPKQEVLPCGSQARRSSLSSWSNCWSRGTRFCGQSQWL